MDIIEYGDKATEELAKLPEELRTAVGRLAYERGHAYGFEEVLNELNDLVFALKEPLKAFENRIREEYRTR